MKARQNRFCAQDQYTPDELELIRECEAYKGETGHRYLSLSEILKVMTERLGYAKPEAERP